MTVSKLPGAIVRPISVARAKRPLNSSAGLSYNGTTHEVPEENSTNIPTFSAQFRAKGEALTDEEKANYVKFHDAVLALLPPEDRGKAHQQIERWRLELEGPTDTE